jgi:hypothetical protein
VRFAVELDSQRELLLQLDGGLLNQSGRVLSPGRVISAFDPMVIHRKVGDADMPCSARSRRGVVIRKVGERARLWPANPPMGFGPAWIVQHAPMSGAGTLVTAAADG